MCAIHAVPGEEGILKEKDSLTQSLFCSTGAAQSSFIFLQEGNRDSYVHLYFAWNNPFNLSDKIHIRILGEKVAVWLALSIDVENRIKHPALYFPFL